MIELKINDVVILENRLYRVENSAFSNGSKSGRRAILKLIRQDEMQKFILENKELLKGGLS